ncbi:MAG: PcfB family protein [Eubacteriaceae bacterium]|nr:PcfB family protein [Eubacteriaceae bacterium]
MNTSNEAEQVVNMTLKGIEVAAKISGEGAKNLAVYLYAVLKEQKKTKGRARLTTMLRSGRELKVFAVKNEDIEAFVKEAKRYGIMYCVLRDKKGIDNMTDIMVKAENGAIINRIFDKLKLASVDMATVRPEVVKGKEDILPNPTIPQKRENLSGDLSKSRDFSDTDVNRPSVKKTIENIKAETAAKTAPKKVKNKTKSKGAVR